MSSSEGSVESDRVVIDLAESDDSGASTVPAIIQIGFSSSERSSSSSSSRRRTATTTSSRNRSNKSSNRNSSRNGTHHHHSSSTSNTNDSSMGKSEVNNTTTNNTNNNNKRDVHRPIKRPCHQRTDNNATTTATTPISFPLLYMEDPNENVEVTEHLLALMDIFELPNTRTCCRSNDDYSGVEVQHYPLLHIHQKDQWSCGFRNLQMLLCGILLMIPSSHPYFYNSDDDDAAMSDNNNNNSASSQQQQQQHEQVRTIPSLQTIQHWLESAWREGFDERGRRDYGGTIASRKKWIGAVEAVSVLWYKNIDAIAVQFITCSSSRKLLAPFVWNYFSCRNCACNYDQQQQQHEPPFAQGPKSSTDYARYLLVLAKTRAQPEMPTCPCPTPPLYLQWKGHSVTIVSIQKRRDDDYYDLILFDPARSGEGLQQQLTSSLEQQQQQQHHQAFKYIKKSSKELLHRDCQIILSTDRQGLSREERHRFKRTYVVTASEADVKERMCSSNNKNARRSNNGNWQPVSSLR